MRGNISRRRRGEPAGWPKVRLRDWQLEIVRMIAELDMRIAARRAVALQIDPSKADSIADNHVITDALVALVERRLNSACADERDGWLVIQRLLDAHPR